jgi:hypothetical protein
MNFYMVWVFTTHKCAPHKDQPAFHLHIVAPGGMEYCQRPQHSHTDHQGYVRRRKRCLVCENDGVAENERCRRKHLTRGDEVESTDGKGFPLRVFDEQSVYGWLRSGYYDDCYL